MTEIVANKWSARFSDLGIHATVEMDITSDFYIVLSCLHVQIIESAQAEWFYQILVKERTACAFKS